MVTLYDPLTEKYRKAKNLQMKVHDIASSQPGGFERDVLGVEFMVVGKSREWIEWRPLVDLKEANPTLDFNKLVNQGD